MAADHDDLGDRLHRLARWADDAVRIRRARRMTLWCRGMHPVERLRSHDTAFR